MKPNMVIATQACPVRFSLP